MNRAILSHLDPKKVLHPKDISGIAAVRKHKNIERFLNATIVKFDEVVSNVVYTGHGFEINSESTPYIYNQFVEDCHILGTEDVPILSAMWRYGVSSDSIGGKRTRIILTSGAIDLLEKEELDFLFGYEIGHIICGHKPYQTMLEMLYHPIINDIDHFNLASLVKMPLLQWFRDSHYSADRMGLLCCQDINVALRTMMKIAGYPKKYYNNININSFIQQAENFEKENGERLTKMIEKFSIQACSMPWLVVRAKELLDWYNSGEYQKIIDNA